MSHRPAAPNLLVPPPALSNCKANSFIEHRVGENESLQDISELYLGKRTQWNLIAACNPDVDPLLTTAGSSIFIPILPQKRGLVARAPKPSTVTKPVKVDPPTSNVAIRGEEKRSEGDVPLLKSGVRSIEPPAVPPPPPVTEEFVVLPPPNQTVVVDSAPEPTAIPTVEKQPDPSPLGSGETFAEEEGSPLTNPSQQTASTLLTCTGKECLPSGN